MCLAWAGCVSLGAEELLGFGSCQSQVLLTPLYPCWALGTAVCPLHVLLSCPSLWAGAVGWAVFQDRDALLQPHAGPGELSPVHCCPWKQGGAFSASLSGATRRSGAVETPLTAEPICVSSGSLFLTPCFWGCSSLLLPQFSTSSSAPSLPWDTLACPMSHCLQGTVLFLPRLWEKTEFSSSQLGREGLFLFLPLSHVYPPFIFTPGCSDGMSLEQPPQVSDLALACSSTAPASPASHSSSFPGKAGVFYPGYGVLVSCLWSCLAQPHLLGLGQAGILPAHGTSIISPSFPQGGFWGGVVGGLPVSGDVPGKVEPFPTTPSVSEPVLTQRCHRLPRHQRFGWVVQNDCSL